MVGPSRLILLRGEIPSDKGTPQVSILGILGRVHSYYVTRPYPRCGTDIRITRNMSRVCVAILGQNTVAPAAVVAVLKFRVCAPTRHVLVVGAVCSHRPDRHM